MKDTTLGHSSLHLLFLVSVWMKAVAGFVEVLAGLVKVVLVAALLWGRHLWAYAASMWALVAFIVYQLYLYARAPSPWLLFLTAVDLVVIYLVWREYQGRKQAMIDADPE